MKTEEAFLSDLERSRASVSRFASLCRAAGVNIWTGPTVVRPSADARSEYADNGDLLVLLRVEHKDRGLSFTCASDFPYDTVIVDEVYKIDRIPHRPFWYVSESSDGSMAAVVSSRTMAHWEKMSLYDEAQERRCEFYACPKRLVRFCALDEVF